MDGILLVDKPRGPTSHDIVDFVRKTFAVPKVGHAGTLDPMATGLLVILIGKLTRSSNRIMSQDKEYEARIVLGATSDTQDACGRITRMTGAIEFTRDRIEEAFKKFTGEIEQRVPLYSAVKKGGKPLYKFARRGIKVEVAPRKVLIEKIELTDVAIPEAGFKVSCSKGTYIRQLASDIGDELGCGAYLSYLRRTRCGRFTVDRALTMEKLNKINGSDLKEFFVNEE